MKFNKKVIFNYNLNATKLLSSTILATATLLMTSVEVEAANALEINNVVAGNYFQEIISGVGVWWR